MSDPERRARQRDRQRRHRANRRAAGLCISCPDPTDRPGKGQCSKCAARVSRREARRRARKALDVAADRCIALGIDPVEALRRRVHAAAIRVDETGVEFPPDLGRGRLHDE